MLAAKAPARGHHRGARRGGGEVHPLAGREPAFKGYRGFPGSICASPNSMVVHGIPGPYELQARRRALDRRRRDQGRLGRRRGDDACRSARSPRGAQAARRDQGVALRRRRADAARQPPRRRLRRDPARGRDRGALDHPHPGRPRDRPRDARGPAGPELRRARQGPGARGGDGAGDRADGQRRRAAGARWATTAGRSTPKDGSLAAHFEFTVAVTADGPADPHPLARRTDRLARRHVFGPADQETWAAVDEFVGATCSRPTTRRWSRRSPAPSRRGLPAIQVSPPQGKLLALLARRSARGRSLEFGTLGGYSTIWLGRALPEDGSLITLEAEPAYAEVARGEPRARRARGAGRPPGRPRPGDAAGARGGGRRPVRPGLHRRRQGQHARVLRLGARAHPPRRPDRRRQRRPRRSPGRRVGPRPGDRGPAPLARDARRRAAGRRDDDPDRRRQGLRRLHDRPGHRLVGTASGRRRILGELRTRSGGAIRARLCRAQGQSTGHSPRTDDGLPPAPASDR